MVAEMMVVEMEYGLVVADLSSILTLTDLLRSEIAAHGPLRFSDFMARALYDLEFGYYATGKARVGRAGDFFTSVSVGPLFGALLARQFAEVWERLDRPEPFDLVEQGAHDGSLAADVLAAMPRECRVRLTLVEPSAHWRAAQQARLANTGVEVRWVGSVEELEPLSGVCYSNELVDAFPVHRVRLTPEGWRELGVNWPGEGFAWAEIEAPLTEALRRGLPFTGDAEAALGAGFQPGYTTEVNLAAVDWMAKLSRRLQRGLILAIDYGFPRADYYALHRTDGTLQAYSAHRVVEPLAFPGEADLTTHVDFSALAEAAQAGGLEVAGFADQHHFLVALSRLYFTDGVPPAPRDLRAFQTLSHPTMLGRAFKVLGVGKGLGDRLSGFAFARGGEL